jgi:hypothetical protein
LVSRATQIDEKNFYIVSILNLIREKHNSC